MNAIKRKLRSNRGASITFALLLFLVCAVVSSIVIVAATTASGRMSSLPDIDQRYYAVSSAVELLGKTLDGQVVTVEKTREQKITYTYKADGTLETQKDPTSKVLPENVPTKIYVGDSAEAKGSNYSLLTSLADTLTNNVLADMDEDMVKTDEDPDNPKPKESTKEYPYKVSRTLSADGELELSSGSITREEGLKILSVEVYQQLDEDGTLTFYVSKPVKNNAGVITGAYTLRMIFASDKTKDTVSHTEHGTPGTTAEGGYTVTDTVTKTTTIKYKWTLTRIEKSSVPEGFPEIITTEHS